MQKLHKFEIGDMLRGTKTAKLYIGSVLKINLTIEESETYVTYTLEACNSSYNFNEKDVELVEIVKKETR